MLAPEKLRRGEDVEIADLRGVDAFVNVSAVVAKVKAVRLALRLGVDLTPQEGPEVRIGDSLKMTVGTVGVLADIHPLRPTLHDAGYRVMIYDQGSLVTFRPHGLDAAETHSAMQIYTPQDLIELDDRQEQRHHTQAFTHFVGEALNFLQEQDRHQST
jgi:hypothetical protein